MLVYLPTMSCRETIVAVWSLGKLDVSFKELNKLTATTSTSGRILWQNSKLALYQAAALSQEASQGAFQPPVLVHTTEDLSPVRAWVVAVPFRTGRKRRVQSSFPGTPDRIPLQHMTANAYLLFKNMFNECWNAIVVYYLCECIKKYIINWIYRTCQHARVRLPWLVLGRALAAKYEKVCN